MSFRVEATDRFAKRLKPLLKKHTSLTQDVVGLIERLAETPIQGESLGRGCYKVRLAIGSKGKGKSGGARVITYVLVQDERVLLLTIYDKADRENLAPGELAELLAELGF